MILKVRRLGTVLTLLGCMVAAVLLLASAVQFVIEVHKAHSRPHVCYDIQHGNYVPCEGEQP